MKLIVVNPFKENPKCPFYRNRSQVTGVTNGEGSWPKNVISSVSLLRALAGDLVWPDTDTVCD